MLIAARAVPVCGGSVGRISGSGRWRAARRDRHRAAGLRAVAPTQLAAAVMLAAGGVVALAASPQTGVLVVIVCVVGAVGTVAAGCWQSARYAAARAEAVAAEAPAARGSCAVCTLSCHSAMSLTRCGRAS